MADTVVVFGIPNCDTVKKARKWLDQHAIDYEFHDYKKSGIDKKSLQQWCKTLGWEQLLNKRGTTWRKLPDVDKSDLTEDKAISIMLANTSVIKRPVVSANNQFFVGFEEPAWCTMFGIS